MQLKYAKISPSNAMQPEKKIQLNTEFKKVNTYLYR